jgi:hypothetical protein
MRISDLFRSDFLVGQFGQYVKPSLTLRGWGRDGRTKGMGSAVPYMAYALDGFQPCCNSWDDEGFSARMRTPFLNLVPQGRLKIGRDAILDNLQPSLRD